MATPASVGSRPEIPSLRRPGAVVLVSCYELGHQPMGLASPLGFLRRAGFQPQAIDLASGELDERLLADAQLVAINTAMHTALRLGIAVARRVRSINPQATICFYGLYALLNAEHLFETCADAVLGGEYEEALVRLAESIEAPDSGQPVEGAARRGDPIRPVLERLNFALPDRSGLPTLDRYARLEHKGRLGLVGYVEASRGCRHLCLHCPIPPVYQGRFFVVPQSLVLEDIRRLVAAGAEHITFGDPDFLNGPGHSLAIARAMHEEFPAVTFDFTAKVEHLIKHGALLTELAELGCTIIISAVESLSDTVLANLDKGHTRADVHHVVEMLRPSGIALRPSLVSFTPWTTLDDYLDVLDFVVAAGLVDHVDPVQYAVRLLVPPGSALLERPAIGQYLADLDEAALTYRWTHPDARMDRLHPLVSGLVEKAGRMNEDSAVTFQKITELAFRMHAARRPARRYQPSDAGRERPPRMTEPWFC